MLGETELSEGKQMLLGSGQKQSISKNPVEYIGRTQMQIEADVRAIATMADMIDRWDPPPPNAAMVDMKDAAELVGRAATGLWKAKGMLKSIVDSMRARPATMVLPR